MISKHMQESLSPNDMRQSFFVRIAELFKGDAEWLNRICGIKNRNGSESREPSPKPFPAPRGCAGR